MGLSTSPELWGKCRECQSQAELIAGKEATDGGCALESALGSPHSLLHSTLLNFGPLPGPPPVALSTPPVLLGELRTP